MKKQSYREIMKKKHLEPGKEISMEKNDILALIIAAGSVFLPIIIGFVAVLALVAFLFVR
jgi:hypothetical protein